MNWFRTRIGPWIPDCGQRKAFPVTFFWLTQSSVLGIFSGFVSIVCAESDFCFTFRLFQLIKIRFFTGRRCRPIGADMKMNLKTNVSSLSTFLGFETVFFWSCFLRFWSVLASLMVSSNGFILFWIHQKRFQKMVNFKLISRKKVLDCFKL